MKASIIIPAFNEEQSIGHVLAEIPMDHVAEVLVIDNGSTDQTAAVAASHGASVHLEPRKGYGNACLKGLACMSPHPQIVVILDGDHSDYPEDLNGILQPILEERADFVIGSRVLGNAQKGALPWNQRFGNVLACSLIRLLYGFRFTDMGPFRAMRRDCFERLRMCDPNFGWNAEMQVKAIMARLRIKEVPVRYRKRIGTSKISGTVKGTILAGMKIIATILRYYPGYVRSKFRRRPIDRGGK
jgi:glycosyltransferase involved in cell wall biosynthesis